MSKDAFRDVTPVDIIFEDGEQPTADKLNGAADEIMDGLDLTTQAIGDVWNDTVFTAGDAESYILSSSGGDAGGEWKPTLINSLARIIGPTSALNPFRQNRDSETVTILSANLQTWIPPNVNEFQLPVAPLVYNGSFPDPKLLIDTSGSENHIAEELLDLDGTVFATKVASKTLVTSTGKYFIDLNGRVYTYTRTGSYSGDFHYLAVLPPDAYDEARMNVIPDSLDDTPAHFATVGAASGGKQLITLPTVVVAPRYAPGTTAAYAVPPGATSNDCLMLPPNAYQAKLPFALTCRLTDGDPIPDGFIQLFQDGVTNNPGGELIDGCQFTYHTDHSFYYLGTDLGTNPVTQKYRVVTTGTTITESINELRFRMDTHAHADRNGGLAVAHSHLANNMISPATVISNWSITVNAPVSLIAGNDHPQYLCRYGYASTRDPGNCDNAMLGDLFMANSTGTYTSDYTDDAGSYDSRKIYFGNTTNYIFHDAASSYPGGLTLTSASHMNTLVANNVAIGNRTASPVSTTYDHVYLKFMRDNSDWGTLIRDYQKGWALDHNGSVANSTLQAGCFFTHDETSQQAVVSDGIKCAALIVRGEVPAPMLYLSNPSSVPHTAFLSLSSSGTCELYSDEYISLNAVEVAIITSHVNIASSGDIDCSGTTGELIAPWSSYPPSPYTKGGLYFNTGSERHEVYDGVGWAALPQHYYFSVPQHNGTPVPPSGVTIPHGTIYYDTGSNHLFVYIGSSFVQLGP